MTEGWIVCVYRKLNYLKLQGTQCFNMGFNEYLASALAGFNFFPTQKSESNEGWKVPDGQLQSPRVCCLFSRYSKSYKTTNVSSASAQCFSCEMQGGQRVSWAVSKFSFAVAFIKCLGHGSCAQGTFRLVSNTSFSPPPKSYFETGGVSKAVCDMT